MKDIHIEHFKIIIDWKSMRKNYSNWANPEKIILRSPNGLLWYSVGRNIIDNVSFSKQKIVNLLDLDVCKYIGKM